jgi:hypothetical protein
MFCQAAVDQWQMTIMQHLSPLSKPQATVLALWSFGTVLARASREMLEIRPPQASPHPQCLCPDTLFLLRVITSVTVSS